ncbi:MAG: PD-(D/E)XK nuclease family protein [Bacilli bacterium]
MNFYEYLYSFDYAIIPSASRMSILKAKKDYPLSHLKVLTKEEIFSSLDFSSTPECEIYLYEEKKYAWNFIPKLLSSLNFLVTPPQLTPKLLELINLKKELFARRLIVKNPYFLQQLNNKKIAVIGFDEDDRELKIFADLLNSEFQFLHLPNVNPKLEVKHFASIEEEVAYFFNYLGAQGIRENQDLNKVKLLNPPAEYEFWLTTLANLYQIPVNLKSNTKLIVLPIVKKFLKYFKKTQNLMDALLIFENYPDLLKKITAIIKTYPANKFKDYPSFLQEIFAAIDAPKKHYEGALEITEDILFQSPTIFALGFIDGHYPKVSKDEDFLNDEEKRLVGRLSSAEINSQARKFLMEKICASTQVVFSYSDKTSTGSTYPSSMISELKFKVVDFPNLTTQYSLPWAQLYAGNLQDLFYKYRESHQDLPLYQHLLKSANYRGYQNKITFKKPINIASNQRYSFSKLDSFFNCPFQYYLEHVVHLNEQEEIFAIKLGQLVHSILEARISDNNFVYEQAFDKFAASNNFTAEESVYLVRIKRELRFTLEFIEQHEKLINIGQIVVEKKFEVNLTNNISLSGVADKIYQINSAIGPLYVVIDYKTGKARYHEAYLPYGLSLQLPIYALLLKKSKEFTTGQVIGLYIHPVLNSKISREAGLSTEEFYRKQLQLVGVSINDKNLLSAFDPTYEYSNFIRSLAVKKDGDFTAHAKVKSAEGFDELAALAEQKVFEADQCIRELAFDIAPIKIATSVDACAYCPYRDICYRDGKDYREIKLEKQSNKNSEDEESEFDEDE